MGMFTFLKARKAATLCSKGDYAGAKKLYQECVNEGLADARSLLTYSVLLIRDSQFKEARELLVNMFSVGFFPLLAMPLISQVLYTGGEEALGQLLDQRKKAVEELVLERVFRV